MASNELNAIWNDAAARAHDDRYEAQLAELTRKAELVDGLIEQFKSIVLRYSAWPMEPDFDGEGRRSYKNLHFPAPTHTGSLGINPDYGYMLTGPPYRVADSALGNLVCSGGRIWGNGDFRRRDNREYVVRVSPGFQELSRALDEGLEWVPVALFRWLAKAGLPTP